MGDWDQTVAQIYDTDAMLETMYERYVGALSQDDIKVLREFYESALGARIVEEFSERKRLPWAAITIQKW